MVEGVDEAHGVYHLRGGDGILPACVQLVQSAISSI